MKSSSLSPSSISISRPLHLMVVNQSTFPFIPPRTAKRNLPATTGLLISTNSGIFFHVVHQHQVIVTPRAAINSRTKMIIVNTPHNPVGKVFTREELEKIAALAKEFNLLVMSDEVVSVNGILVRSIPLSYLLIPVRLSCVRQEGTCPNRYTSRHVGTDCDSRVSRKYICSVFVR